jgi:hypothetical protein
VSDAEDNDVARPPRFSEVLNEAARLYRARFAALVPTFFVAYIAILALQLLALIDLSDAALATLLFALELVGALVGTALFAAASIVFSDHVNGSQSSLRTALLSLRPLTSDLIRAALFSAILSIFALTLIGGISLLFIGPPIVVQLIAIDRLHLRDAWSRTRVIASGQWPRIVGVLLVIVLVMALVPRALFGFIELGPRLATDASRFAVLALLQVLVAGLAYPYLAAAQFVLYRDLTERAGEAHVEE